MNQTPSWRQVFVYDRYGNRRFDEAGTTTLGSCPAAQCNPQIDQLTNRFATGQGYVYDESGSLIQDAAGRRYVYDGESKQTEVRDAANNVIGRYFYDGDGRRVKKIVPSTGETTIFVYDASGRLVAEYSTIVADSTDAKVAYLTNDHLGSPRINTDSNGAVTARHDYHPFGEEIGTLPALPGSPQPRTTALGYQSDSVRQKFTGYERDDETELDFAQARMYSYSHGRFTSSDPLLASAIAENPQSWHRYIYTFNNPLRFTDPTGMIVDDYFINRDGSYVVVKNDCKCHNYYIETEKGSREYRHLATLEENDAGLVEFPAEMDFFSRYGSVDKGGGDHGAGDHFVKPEVAAGLFGVAAVLRDEYGITMSFGDMSSSNGRDPWQPGMIHHSGHGHNGRSGLDVDFRYINKDGDSFQSKSARSDSQFSVEKNQTVYDVAKTFGFTENYQGNSQGKNTGLKGVKAIGGHNDHGHLGYNRNNARITYAKGVMVLGGRGIYKPLF